MAKIQSFLSNAYGKVADPAKSAGSAAKQVAQDKLSTTADNLVQDTADRWESARDRGRNLADSLGSSVALNGDAAVTVRDAVVGNGQTGAARGLEKMASWFEPSSQMLDSIDELRTGIQDRVRQQAEPIDGEDLEYAFEYASSQFGDLAERIQDQIADRADSVLQKSDDLAEQMGRLGIDARAGAQDRVNETLNRLGSAAAEGILAHRTELEAFGQSLQAAAQHAPDTPDLATPLEILLPTPYGADTAARWSLDALGSLVSGGVDAAEYFAETPGLPTRGNFEEWIDQIDPGEALHIEGRFVASVAAGPGLRAGAGQELILERCASDPDRLTLTVARDGEALALLGKDLQGEGLSAGVGLGEARALQFDFDTSRADDRELLADLVLANQMGSAPKSTVAAAGDRLMSMTTEIHTAGSLDIGPSVAGLDLETGMGGIRQWEIRADGPVDRIAMRYSGELSVGGKVGRLPQTAVDELAMTAPPSHREAAQKFFSELSKGNLGLNAGTGTEFVAGVEIENHNVERLFFEATVDGEFLGLDRRVDMEIAVHDPQQFARALGTSAAELPGAIASGQLDLMTMMEAADNADIDLGDAFGIKVTDTQIHTDGYGLDVAGITLGSTAMREDEQVLFELGTGIDRSPPPRDDRATQFRILDRLLWV